MKLIEHWAHETDRTLSTWNWSNTEHTKLIEHWAHETDRTLSTRNWSNTEHTKLIEHWTHETDRTLSTRNWSNTEYRKMIEHWAHETDRTLNTGKWSTTKHTKLTEHWSTGNKKTAFVRHGRIQYITANTGFETFLQLSINRSKMAVWQQFLDIYHGVSCRSQISAMREVWGYFLPSTKLACWYRFPVGRLP